MSAGQEQRLAELGGKRSCTQRARASRAIDAENVLVNGKARRPAARHKKRVFSVPGGGLDTKIVRNPASEPAGVELAPKRSGRLVAFQTTLAAWRCLFKSKPC